MYVHVYKDRVKETIQAYIYEGVKYIETQCYIEKCIHLQVWIDIYFWVMYRGVHE